MTTQAPQQVTQEQLVDELQTLQSMVNDLGVRIAQKEVDEARLRTTAQKLAARLEEAEARLAEHEVAAEGDEGAEVIDLDEHRDDE